MHSQILNGLQNEQNMARCLNYNKKYAAKRYCIQIKWYSIFDDIIEYMNKSIANKS